MRMMSIIFIVLLAGTARKNLNLLKQFSRRVLKSHSETIWERSIQLRWKTCIFTKKVICEGCIPMSLSNFPVQFFRALANSSFLNLSRINQQIPLDENCSNAGFFLACSFLYLDWLQQFTEKISLFSRNTWRCGPEKIPIRRIFTQCSPLWNHFWNRNKSQHPQSLWILFFPNNGRRWIFAAILYQKGKMP